MKTTKTAEDFTPQIDSKLPAGIKPLGLPRQLTQQIPQLTDYGYVKMKNEILIVNAMNGKIAAIIVETKAQTTGQK